MDLTLPSTWILNKRGRPRDDLAMSKKAASYGRSIGYVSPIPTRSPSTPPKYSVIASSIEPCGTMGGIVLALDIPGAISDHHHKFTWTYGKKFLWWGVDRTKIIVQNANGSDSGRRFIVLSDSWEIVETGHDRFDWQIAQAQCIRAHLKKELFNVELERMLL